jgi:hypothetical protein
MQLSAGVDISHPHLAGISAGQGVCEVVLSEAFSSEFRKFTPEIREGFIEIEGNLGLVEADGRVLWLHGHGRTFEEAIQNALATFINWVVHPADVCAVQFRLRPSAA